MKDKLIRLLNAHWVVDDDGDPGISIGRGLFRIVVGYYKWADSFIVYRPGQITHRRAAKRELNISR